MIPLAGSFALGIAVTRVFPAAPIWTWLTLAGVSLILGIVLWRYSWNRVQWTIWCCVLFIGSSWVEVREHLVGHDDLAGWIKEQSTLVRVRGIATHDPELKEKQNGSMARFDYRDPSTSFPLKVTDVISREGPNTPVTGNLWVRVRGTVEPFHAGDKVEAIGFLRRTNPPQNPGEFDLVRYARSLGQAGILHVESRDLLTITPATHGRFKSSWLLWREKLHHRARVWLLSYLPETENTDRDALLLALLLGQREPDLDGLGDTFLRVGLAHMLAISGFHLGVLVGFVLLVARFLGAGRRANGILILFVVLAYLFLVEVRLPVLRAAVMLIVVAGGMVCNRRWKASSLLSLSAIGLLLWRPDQLFTAGFQLSFGVVLGLLLFSMKVRERWFGLPKTTAATSMEMIGQWLMNTLAVAVTAWAVAAPIVAYHFGIVTPLGALLSVVVLPLVSILLALGYVKLLLTVILPSAALLLGVPLAVVTDALVSFVRAADTIPGSIVHVPFPPIAWAILSLCWVALWGVGLFQHRRRLVRRVMLVAGAGIVLWLFWPMLPIHSRPPLRVDMISVGDGSCYLLRSESSAVVFDAGSAHDLNAGRRTIIPAFRRLGVRKLDAIMISHHNMDHYSAVIELVDEFRVENVYVTPQLLWAAEENPHSPIAYLVEELSMRMVPIREAAMGASMTFGKAQWTWFHPVPDEIYRRNNDASMVVRIEAAGRALLMAGDIQEYAVDQLFNRGELMPADILELPHHGGYTESASRFARHISPQVVLQSAGWTRWSRDRWLDELAGCKRLVTALDGACWIEVNKRGEITFGSFCGKTRNASINYPSLPE